MMTNMKVYGPGQWNSGRTWTILRTDPSKFTRDFQILIDSVRGFIFLGSSPNLSEVWFFCWSWPDPRFHFCLVRVRSVLSIDPWSFHRYCWLLLKLASKSCCFLYSLSTDIFRQTIWSLSETNLSSHFLTWKNLKVFQRWQN